MRIPPGSPRIFFHKYMKVHQFAQYLFNKYAKFSNMTPEAAAAVLGVSLPTSKDDLKKAYRRKALELHPDRNADRDTTDDLKEVNIALEILSKHLQDSPQRPADPIAGKDSFDVLLDSRAESGPWGVRKSFNFGKYGLSIQGGSDKYSEPRENLPNLSQYSRLEVAIINNEADPNDWKNFLVPLYTWDGKNEDPQILKDFGDMPSHSYWESDKTVGPFIPKDEVRQIFEFFQRKFGLISELG